MKKQKLKNTSSFAWGLGVGAIMIVLFFVSATYYTKGNPLVGPLFSEFTGPFEFSKNTQSVVTGNTQQVVDNRKPCVPTLTSPVTNTQVRDVDSMNFTWEPSCLADRYIFSLFYTYKEGTTKEKMFDATVPNISLGFPYLNPWGDVYPNLPIQYAWSVSACNTNGCVDSEKRDFKYSMKAGDVGTVKAKAGSKKGFIDLSWEMGKYTPTSTYYLFKNDLVAKTYSFTQVSIPSYPPETFGTSDLRVDSAKPNVLHWTGDKNFFNCGFWDLGVVACDQNGKQCSVSSSFTSVDMKKYFVCS